MINKKVLLIRVSLTFSNKNVQFRPSCKDTNTNSLMKRLVFINLFFGISRFSDQDSIIFLYFFALIIEEGFLISGCYSLELCIQMGLSFLFFFFDESGYRFIYFFFSFFILFYFILFFKFFIFFKF